jgi:hypothetical protein
MYKVTVQLKYGLYILGIVCWNITSCSSVEVYWRSGGTLRLHLQGRRISQKQQAEPDQTTQRYIPEDGTLKF